MLRPERPRGFVPTTTSLGHHRHGRTSAAVADRHDDRISEVTLVGLPRFSPPPLSPRPVAAPLSPRPVAAPLSPRPVAAPPPPIVSLPPRTVTPARRRRRWRWVALAALPLLIGLLWMTGPDNLSAASPTGDLVVVKRGPLAVKVLTTGRVEPGTQSQIRSRVGGIVARVLVSEGEPVEQGQPLLEIDATEYRRDVERLTSEMAERRAELRLASSRLANVRKGMAHRVIAAAELESAIAEVALARARLQSAGISRASAEDRLQSATVLAPFEGTIIHRNVQPGEVVVPGVTATVEGRPLLVLGDTGTLILRSELNQIDFARIRRGNRAAVTFDALPGKRFEAELTTLPASTLRGGSGVEAFSVQLRLKPGAELALLKPGMSADVEIAVATKQGVLLVPIEAVAVADGKRTVAVWNELRGSYETRAVVTGEQDDEQIEILEGLREGDRVQLGAPAASGT